MEGNAVNKPTNPLEYIAFGVAFVVGAVIFGAIGAAIAAVVIIIVFAVRVISRTSVKYAAGRDEAAAQAEAQSLVAKIAELTGNSAIPSAEDFVNSVLGAYAEGQAEDGRDVMAAEALRAFAAIVEQIYKDEINALATPPAAPERLASFDGEKYRAELRPLAQRLGNPMALVNELRIALTMAASILTYDLPPAARQRNYDEDLPESPFAVPLIDLFDPEAAKEAINGLRICFFRAESAKLGLFGVPREQVMQNGSAASKAELSQRAFENGETVDPKEHPGTPREIAKLYLADTPFMPLLDVSIPFVIPKAARFEHTHIVAGTGHGKTQLLQRMMLADFDDPERPAVVALDSQGDMLKTLSHLDRFNPETDDRLIIVNPADYEWPLRLNIFDIPRDRLACMSPGPREQTRAGIIELYDYIFGGLLGADLTQKQSVVFRYIAALMIDIPDATIQTLRQLLENPATFGPYIAQTRGTTRAFFENEFMSRQFADTRSQIIRRLYGLLSNPTFERMFSHPRNALDMKAALDQGKVILINTAKDVLKAEASQMFGRYMIALIMQAALERAADPEHQRRPAFVYIDEAADYFDENIDTLLIQARKYKVGLTFAHQHLDQLSTKLYSSVMTNPAIRFAGGISASDARALAPEMRTSVDHLLTPKKSARATEFATYVRNTTVAPVILSVPLGVAEREPKMSARHYEAMLTRVRREIAAPLADTEQHITASVPSAAPTVFAPPPPRGASPNVASPPEPPKPAPPPAEFSDNY